MRRTSEDGSERSQQTSGLTQGQQMGDDSALPRQAQQSGGAGQPQQSGAPRPVRYTDWASI